MFKRFWSWWRNPERRRWREARSRLDGLFREQPELLKGTSLRPKHRGRTQILQVEDSRIVFGILRHPRPYAFSRQFHEVVEIWCFDSAEQRRERLEGHNVTRERGGDGEPPGHGV